MGEWFRRYDGVLFWVGIGSLGFVALSLALVPMLIARLPPDYFAHERRHGQLRQLPPALRAGVLVAKNLLGLVLLLCGALMLILPGQGVLTLLLGLSLLDFPGKYRLERWLLRRRAVFGGLNWIRRRLQEPEFVAPPESSRLPQT